MTQLELFEHHPTDGQLTALILAWIENKDVWKHNEERYRNQRERLRQIYLSWLECDRIRYHENNLQLERDGTIELTDDEILWIYRRIQGLERDYDST